MTPQAAAGIRGGGDEVLEVGAGAMGAALTGLVPRWAGLEDPGFPQEARVLLGVSTEGRALYKFCFVWGEFLKRK